MIRSSEERANARIDGYFFGESLFMNHYIEDLFTIAWRMLLQTLYVFAQLLIYLNDAIIIRRTFVKGFEYFKLVFEHLDSEELNPHPNQSFLSQKQVSHLGHAAAEN